MHPFALHAHVQHHVASLTAEAAAERLAERQRRAHAREHLVHQALDHDHRPNRLRGAVGRLLIGVGSAIAGSAASAGARRPA